MKNKLLLLTVMVAFVATSFGQAIQFKDSSYIYLDDNITALGEAATNVTIESWIKPDTTGGWKDWAAAVYLRNDAGASLGLNVTSWGADSIQYVPLWQDIYWIEPEINVPINKWSHIAMTVDVNGNTFKAYLNGNLVYTYVPDGGDNPDLTTQSFMGTEPLCIGKDRYDLEWTGRTFKGGIDEVRIWNKTLTDAEIAANWNKKLSGDETGLVAYYDFTTVIGAIVTNGGVGPTATLHFADNAETITEGEPVGIMDRMQVLENVEVFASNNTIYVNNQNGLVNVEVINVIGQVLKSEDITGNTSITMDNSNVYIVKVTNGAKTYATKVLVR